MSDFNNKPLVICISIRNHESFTRHMRKPVDYVVLNAMQETLKALCETVPDCVFGYTTEKRVFLVLCVNEGTDVSDLARTATDIFNAAFRSNADEACQYFDTETSMEAALQFDYSVYKQMFGEAVLQVEQKSEIGRFLTECQMAAHQLCEGEAPSGHHLLNKDIDLSRITCHNVYGACCYKLPKQAAADGDIWVIDKELWLKALLAVAYQDYMELEAIVSSHTGSHEALVQTLNGFNVDVDSDVWASFDCNYKHLTATIDFCDGKYAVRDIVDVRDDEIETLIAENINLQQIFQEN